MSKKALWKFATKLLNDSEHCNPESHAAEDMEMGACLESHAIPLDGHDLSGQKEFFPVEIENHLTNLNRRWWYTKNMWHSYPYGMNCCAETIANLHYIPPEEIELLNYLIYKVHPFGLEKSQLKDLPKKIKLEDLIKLSDVASNSPNYRKHKFVHFLDEDEKN